MLSPRRTRLVEQAREGISRLRGGWEGEDLCRDPALVSTWQMVLWPLSAMDDFPGDLCPPLWRRCFSRSAMRCFLEGGRWFHAPW